MCCSVFFFFNQNQPAPDLISKIKCGLLGSCRFLFVLFLIHSAVWNIKRTNGVAEFGGDEQMENRNGFGRAYGRALNLACQTLLPLTLFHFHCSFQASLLLSGRLSVHTACTFILFGQPHFQGMSVFVRAQVWHLFCELHIPYAQKVPLTSPSSLCLNRKSLSSCIS